MKGVCVLASVLLRVSKDPRLSVAPAADTCRNCVSRRFFLQLLDGYIALEFAECRFSNLRLRAMKRFYRSSETDQCRRVAPRNYAAGGRAVDSRRLDGSLHGCPRLMDLVEVRIR